MLAYVITDDGASFQTDLLIPQRQPGEALIQILRAGICNTDLEILQGYMKFRGILGHEFVGKVLDIDDGSSIKVGQRVVGEINLACNECDICKEGDVIKRNHCKNRTVLGILNKDGTYATHMILPAVNLFVVPANITDEQAVFVEPLAAAFRIVEQNLIKTSDNVAVLGDGKLGLLIAEVMHLQKPKKLIVFGKHEKKLALLPSDLQKEISNERSVETFADYFDVVIDATGHPGGIAQACQITKPLGTIVLKTTCATDANFQKAVIVIKEINIVGSRCGNFPMAIKALSERKVNVQKFIAGVYPFSEVDSAIICAKQKGTLKVQLLMSDS